MQLQLLRLENNNKCRMSVSLSSIFSQTPALRELEEKIQNDLGKQQNIPQNIKEIVNQTNDLTMPESYRLLTILAKDLKSSHSVQRKFIVLLIAKELFLTARHHLYIFGSIKILPWIKSIATFQTRKTQRQRVKLFLQQLSLKGNGDEVIQQRYCYKLLKFIEEYLPWFSSHFPNHINAQFEYQSTFVRSAHSIHNPRNLQGLNFEYFSEQDMDKFEKNFNILKCESSLEIKQLCEFVALQLRIAVDKKKQKSQILKELIKTADSYCIRAVISQFTSLLEDSTQLNCTMKILSYLMNLAEIQYAELVKLYCVPIILEYIICVDFHAGQQTKSPSRKCSIEDQKLIIDSIYLWQALCLQIGISDSLYRAAITRMQQDQKPIFHVNKKHYTQFSTNLVDMIKLNEQKKPNIVNSDIEKELITIILIRRQQKPEPSKQIPELWKSNFSAINQLDQFQESRAIFGGKKAQNTPFWKSKASHVSSIRTNSQVPFFKSNALDSQRAAVQNYGIRINKQQNTNNLKVSTGHYQEKMILTGFNEGSFHVQETSQIQKGLQLQKLPNSSLKPSSSKSLKDLSAAIYYDNRVQPKKNKPNISVSDASGSSYVAFEASKFSSFSQYSVKHSNKNKQLKNIQIKKHGPKKIKQSSLKSSLSKSKQSQSANVIYFANSQQFNSVSQSQSSSLVNQQNLLKFSQQNDQKIGIIPDEYSNLQYMTGNRFNKPNKERLLESSRQSNLSLKKSSKSSCRSSSETYHFKNSMQSIKGESSQNSNSKILNYGIQGHTLPQPTKKMKFGFVSKRDIPQVGNQSKNQDLLMPNRNTYTNNKPSHNNLFDDILSNEGSQMMINSYQFTKSNNKFLNSGRLMQSQGRQISEIKQNHNNKKLTGTDQFYKIKKKGGVGLISQHYQNQQSSSEIKDQQYRKYQLNESQDKRDLIKLAPKHLQDKLTFQQGQYKKPKDKFIIEQYHNDELYDLQMQMGRIKKQKHKKQRHLRQKEQQYKMLKLQSVDNEDNRQHLKKLKKQNEIIQLLVYQKNKEQYQIQNNHDMMVQPIKNCNQIQDYFLENQAKGIYSHYVQPFQRLFTKQILGSRCLLIKNQYMELGYNYSQRQNQISLYLTLLKSFDLVTVGVLQNSILLDKMVDLSMNDQPAYNQMKIKRKVIGLNQKKKQPTFSEVIHQSPSYIIVYPEVSVVVSQKQVNQHHQFVARIPCSVFNLAVAVEITTDIIKQLKYKKVIKSIELFLAEQFMRHPKQKIAKYFPKYMGLVGGWCLIGFEYPVNIFGIKQADFIKFRIQNQKVQFQFFGEPKNPLTETIVCMLVGEQPNK